MGVGGSGTASRGLPPVQRKRIVGRESETSELVRLVAQERLLSLVGAPGCGKTRLAVEVGAQVAPRFAGGVRFVELAPIGLADSLAQAVGVASDVWEEPGRPMEDVLVEALGASEPVLLVLDNCEHLIDGVAALAQRLLVECPLVSVLATSRLAFGLPGERVWNVPPLDVAPACELFLDRARSVCGADMVLEANSVVEEICVRLDCLPLAIELTAAWSRVVSPSQILARLVGASSELPSSTRGSDRRHVTMAAAVDWSCQLLPAEVQRLFERLSVFAGGFDLDAIEAIADPCDDPLVWLTVLVDNSLVLVEGLSGGIMRYRMLEPVRQHAATLLAVHGDPGTARRRHYDHYLQLGEGYEPWQERRGGGAVRLERLAQEEGNLLAALEWARQQPSDLSLRLVVGWAAYVASAARVNDGLRWLEDALAKGTQDRHLRARALAECGYLSWRQGDYDLAHARLEEALALAGPVDDPFLSAQTLIRLSAAEFSAGVIDDAARHAREAIDIYRACGDELYMARALVALAWTRYARGNRNAGDELMLAALAPNGRLGNPSLTAYGHFGLAYGAALGGDVRGLRRHMAAAAAGINDGGIVERADWLGMGAVLAGFERRFRSALRLFGGAETFRRRRGGPQSPAQLQMPFVQVFEPVAKEVRPSLSARLTSHGRRMRWEELVAEALAEPGTSRSRLSAREREIADLVAEGLTNGGIAEKLVISRRTVDAHIGHIKQKLAVRGRNEIIVWVLGGSPP